MKRRPQAVSMLAAMPLLLAGSDGKLEHYKTTRYGSPYHFKQHGE